MNAMSAALWIVAQARCNCDATEDHSQKNFHYHIEYCTDVWLESAQLDDYSPTQVDELDKNIQICIDNILEVIEGPFKYIVGCEYRTQEGNYVKVLGRAGRDLPGYETLICSDNKHRYDRSDGWPDAGRVTGTAHDYSHGANFTRALQLTCSQHGCTDPANRRRQLTAYVGSDNMGNLCIAHQEEEDDYWKERWADYRGGVIV